MVLVDLDDKAIDPEQAFPEDFEGGGSDFDLDDLEKEEEEIQNSQIEFSIDEIFGYGDDEKSLSDRKKQVGKDIFINQFSPHKPDQTIRVPDPTASTA
mmetsp:Transcript_31239/g.47818  ORF Transcript_31239/g.47818 Transcript_31239/m.47818 type:complete len:98 (+) Transcript_31239:897-1190(+)